MSSSYGLRDYKSGNDNANFTVEEKPGFGTRTSSSAEPAEYGQVSRAKNRFGFSWAVEQDPSSFAATPNASNKDFDPIPPSRRTWGWTAYVAYWMVSAWRRKG